MLLVRNVKLRGGMAKKKAAPKKRPASGEAGRALTGKLRTFVIESEPAG